MQRGSKEARKVVADTIKTRVSMKRRRTSLQQKPSQEVANTSESGMESNDGIEKGANDGESKEDLIREMTSWPQTLIFPEGYTKLHQIS